MPNLTPHVCLSDAHCAAEGHDRTCAAPGCNDEIKNDVSDVCESLEHLRHYSANYDPYDPEM